jgi:hypothetical protein
VGELNNVTKKDMRKCARGRGSLVELRSMRWVMSCHQFVGIVSPKIMGACTSFEVVGVLALPPGYLIASGGPMRLASGPGPHSH